MLWKYLIDRLLLAARRHTPNCCWLAKCVAACLSKVKESTVSHQRSADLIRQLASVASPKAGEMLRWLRRASGFHAIA